MNNLRPNQRSQIPNTNTPDPKSQPVTLSSETLIQSHIVSPTSQNSTAPTTTPQTTDTPTAWDTTNSTNDTTQSPSLRHIPSLSVPCKDDETARLEARLLDITPTITTVMIDAQLKIVSNMEVKVSYNFD